MKNYITLWYDEKNRAWRVFDEFETYEEAAEEIAKQIIDDFKYPDGDGSKSYKYEVRKLED